MSKICLTPKQELYLNVIKQYHKAHGTFPTQTQLITAVRAAGGKAGQSVVQMYGTLLLKGAFTNGVVLTDSMNALHTGGNVTPIDIDALQFNPKPITRGRKLGGKNKPKTSQQETPTNVLAAALLELLKSSPQFNTIAAQLRG